MLNKEIFFFWGNPTMSWMRYMTLASFRKLNPEWKITLYTFPCKPKTKPWKDHNDQDFFTFKGVDYLPKVEALDIEVKQWNMAGLLPENISSSHISNFFKWHTLATQGGIYADMDILWVKPFDEFYEKIKDMDLSICATKFFSIGLLSSSPKNIVFERALGSAYSTYTNTVYQSAGVVALYVWLYGPKILEHEYKIWGALAQKESIFADLQNAAQDKKMYNIPMDLIYHLDCTQMEQMFETTVTIPEETIGLHWYAGHPLAQKFNNLLTSENFREHQNTFTENIK